MFNDTGSDLIHVDLGVLLGQKTDSENPNASFCADPHLLPGAALALRHSTDLFVFVQMRSEGPPRSSGEEAAYASEFSQVFVVMLHR